MNIVSVTRPLYHTEYIMQSYLAATSNCSQFNWSTKSQSIMTRQQIISWKYMRKRLSTQVNYGMDCQWHKWSSKIAKNKIKPVKSCIFLADDAFLYFIFSTNNFLQTNLLPTFLHNVNFRFLVHVNTKYSVRAKLCKIQDSYHTDLNFLQYKLKDL